MSAVVQPSGFQWFCADCVAGDDGYEVESDADAAAEQHDRLNKHGNA